MATDATGAPTPLGIPTYNINVDAPSGNGFNAAMSVIDTLISARAPLASPALTGTPTAPTPATADNSTKIATTAFVKAQSSPVSSVFGRTGVVVATAGDYDVSLITGAAPLASPTFTGTPAAPTPATADNSTKVATTAFVKAQGYLTSAPVTSVFGRTGAVVAASGDYTAAQVTNAADKSSVGVQAFNGAITASLMEAAGFYPTANAGSGLTGGTITPDLTLGQFWGISISAGGGTVTVANPSVNTPTGKTGLLFIEVMNNGTSSTAITWQGAYLFSNVAEPISVNAGARILVMFAWDAINSSWLALAKY